MQRTLWDYFEESYKKRLEEEKKMVIFEVIRTEEGEIVNVYFKGKRVGFINPTKTAFIKEITKEDEHILRKTSSVGTAKAVLEKVKEKYPSVKRYIVRFRIYTEKGWFPLDYVVDFDTILYTPDLVVNYEEEQNHIKLPEDFKKMLREYGIIIE